MFKRVGSSALVLSALLLVNSAAHAAAEAYATDVATYISGDGKLTQIAIIAALAGFVVVGWVARKLGFGR
ncbi:MAG: hypothetical protein H7831_15990 [Magnetococcus sp. WYHC-3]